MAEKELSYIVFNPAWMNQPVEWIPDDSNIADLITKQAEKQPEKTALICYDREVSFGELDELTNRLASGLISEFGVKKGDRVATMFPNCIQHTLAYLGINKAGAVATPINVMYREREIAYQLSDSGAETVIALDAFYPLIQKAKGTTPLKNIIVSNLRDFTAPDADIPALFAAEKVSLEGAHKLVEFLDKASPKRPEIEIDGKRDLSLILYTAGTTGGTPKGVMECHFLCWGVVQTLKAFLELDENDVDLQIMPMFHTAGYNLGQMPTLAAGGTVILFPLFRDPKELLDWIIKYKVNLLFGPPTLYIALLSLPEINKVDLSYFKQAISCGAHTPDYIIDKWNEMTGITLMDGLGLTETHCASVLSGGLMNLPNRSKPGALGSTLSAVKIVNEKGEIVPRGEVGELMFLLGGDWVRGYWNKPDETRATFTQDGWLHTGDACYVDEDGFGHFVDRYKDIIVASGYNVAPAEIEDEILKHQAVFEVAAVGVSDPYRGETVKAFVHLKDEFKGKVTEQEIIDFCKGKMATFKVPRAVEFIDAIPKNPVGKVLRRELREKG